MDTIFRPLCTKAVTKTTLETIHHHDVYYSDNYQTSLMDSINSNTVVTMDIGRPFHTHTSKDPNGLFGFYGCRHIEYAD